MIDNWWTSEDIPSGRESLAIARGRVHFWLAMYPQLEMAVRLCCSIDDDGTGSTSSDDTQWERYVTTKADIDLALKHCTSKQQRAVRAKFHEGLPYRDVAEDWGCSHVNVIKLCQAAMTIIAKRLAGANE